MLKYLPVPDTNVSNGSANYNRTSLIKSKWTQEYTGKVEHKFSDIAKYHEAKKQIRLETTRAEFAAKFGHAPKLLDEAIAAPV